MIDFLGHLNGRMKWFDFVRRRFGLFIRGGCRWTFVSLVRSADFKRVSGQVVAASLLKTAPYIVVAVVKFAVQFAHTTTIVVDEPDAEAINAVFDVLF